MISQWFLYSVSPLGVLVRVGAYATAAAAITDQMARQISFPTNSHIIQNAGT